MKNILTAIIILIEILSYSQTDSISKNKFIIPGNLNQCILELNKVFTSKAKQKIKSLKEDTVKYIFGIHIIKEWLDPDSSRLKKYFNTCGLNYNDEMEYFIMLSYYQYLTTGNFDISKQLKNYNLHLDSLKSIQKARCDSMQRLDSIDGIYIPENLADCYLQLDKILRDETKKSIRDSDTNIIDFHFSLGRGIRNNWGLWNCSRLSKYFKDNKVNHPDEMSGLIMDGYQMYLKDKLVDIQALISRIPPPPEFIEEIKFIAPYDKSYKKFLRWRKIDDFDFGSWPNIE